MKSSNPGGWRRNVFSVCSFICHCSMQQRHRTHLLALVHSTPRSAAEGVVRMHLLPPILLCRLTYKQWALSADINRMKNIPSTFVLSPRQWPYVWLPKIVHRNACVLCMYVSANIYMGTWICTSVRVSHEIWNFL